MESGYATCLAHEFEKRGMGFPRQCRLPVFYDGITIDAGLRFDLMVEESVNIELKAVEKIIPLYKAQILTYLKLSGLRIGFLINVNVPRIKDGINRVIL